MPRAPKHFKVHASILNHEKTAAWASDPYWLGLYVKIGLLAVDRYADRTGDSFIIHDRELPSLTGKGRADVARKSLRHLADVSPMSAEPDGDIWRITIPNFAKKQGFRSRNGSETVDPSTSTTTTTSKKSKKARSSPTATTRAVAPGKRSDRDRARDAWPKIREAFAGYGANLSAEIRGDRLKLLAARLADGYSEEDLVAAVHGYVAGHGGLEPAEGSDFDPRKYFRPQTVYKASGFADRVDAGRVVARGETNGAQRRVLRLLPESDVR